MKTICAIVLLLGLTGTCPGQGTIWWDASFVGFAATTNAQYYSPLYGDGYVGVGEIGRMAPASSGLQYCFELLYNTAFTGSQAPVPGYSDLFGGAWLDSGLTATNGIAVGRPFPANPSSNAVVPWDNGTTNNIIVVGWSANLGTTWMVVSNELANWSIYRSSFTGQQTFFGESDTGYLTPNPSGTAGAMAISITPSGMPNGYPINAADGMQMFLLPVPEPSTFALAGLGVLSLFVFLRRRDVRA